jgi:hypothetical protein
MMVGTARKGVGKVDYLPKNNPWMEQEEPPRIKFIRVDEHGRTLTPEESRAIRHSMPGRITRS